MSTSKNNLGKVFLSKKKQVKPSKSNKWTPSEGKNILIALSQKYNLNLESEFFFDSVREYRFDFCFTDLKIGIEFDGGVWSKKPMGHNTGEGITRDIEKGNLAQIQSYMFLRFTYQQEKSYLLYIVENAIQLKLN